MTSSYFGYVYLQSLYMHVHTHTHTHTNTRSDVFNWASLAKHLSVF